MSSGSGVFVLLTLLVFQICSVSGFTYDKDFTALQALRKTLIDPPETWKRTDDPCGRVGIEDKDKWVGIECSDNGRVVQMYLGNFNLNGTLPESITDLSELVILDMTSNPFMTGPLPPNIGKLKKLTILHLMGCNFTGQIPESIGELKQLTRLSLNSNRFSGTIPASIGLLSKLDWLDITDNNIQGTIPVSTNTSSSPGLDMLLQAEHFHFGKNNLSGDIPDKLFSSNMSLKHVLFDGNQFTGTIPNSIGLVKTLQVIRLDRNRLSGDIPSNLNNLTQLQELYLANNRFTGSLPNLNNLINLYTLDVSYNRLNSSFIPSWIPSLESLAILRMEGLNLQGQIPTDLFSPRNLETVRLKRNWLNGTLDLSTNRKKKLDFVDLQYNDITQYKDAAKNYSNVVILANNPVCPEVRNKPDGYCTVVKQNSSFYAPHIELCDPGFRCSNKTEPLPNCRCVYPLKGTLTFRSPSFSSYSDDTIFQGLHKELDAFFTNARYPVASTAIRNIREDEIEYHLLIDVSIFPRDNQRFNRTGMASVNFAFSNQTYKPPLRFGPYVFEADPYDWSSDTVAQGSKLSKGVIIAVVGGAVSLLLLLIIAGIYALRQKKRAERASEQINPFAKWDKSNSCGEAPQLMVAKAFTFEEMKKYANNFNMANDVGGGGYGQVYKGILPSGQHVAIKRAQPGSLQGGLEFKTEIELLSRVHHKNVVRLLGFCFDRGEQMLVYEYIPNGSLRDSLSGKSGIRLDWIRRLKIALGSGKGLAYLHELADPPIIHRDVKSSNILLDEDLTAKVADFGLSKLVSEAQIDEMQTQVKGTMGYLDPEYYMTNQLTEKSDVYGFGVMMLELLTGRIPIENGKYVVKEMMKKMNKSKKLYDLQELLDIAMYTNGQSLKGFEKYVDLALSCVDPEGVKRPSMSEVVREIENIMQYAGLNPNLDSAPSSTTYDEAGKGSAHPYGNNSFDYSANFPTSNIEPQ